jgi:two-component system chemotaxis response regulator CheY
MKLLVVDDSYAARRLLINTLRMSGLALSEVYEAGDGPEALVAIAKTQPDVILCDFSMPKMDGITFVGLLRQKYDSEAVKIVMLTARGGPGIEDRARQAGVDVFLHKPVDDEELVSALGSLWDRDRAAPA